MLSLLESRLKIHELASNCSTTLILLKKIYVPNTVNIVDFIDVQLRIESFEAFAVFNWGSSMLPKTCSKSMENRDTPALY